MRDRGDMGDRVHMEDVGDIGDMGEIQNSTMMTYPWTEQNLEMLSHLKTRRMYPPKIENFAKSA